jgi:hypothetical protein
MTEIVNYLLKSQILYVMGAILQGPSQEKGWQNQLKILVPLPRREIYRLVSLSAMSISLESPFEVFCLSFSYNKTLVPLTRVLDPCSSISNNAVIICFQI